MRTITPTTKISKIPRPSSGLVPRDFTGFGIIPGSRAQKEVRFPSKLRPCKWCYPDPTQIDPLKISTSRSRPNKFREKWSTPVISQSGAVQTRRCILISQIPSKIVPRCRKRTGLVHITVMTSSGLAGYHEMQCRM